MPRSIVSAGAGFSLVLGLAIAVSFRMGFPLHTSGKTLLPRSPTDVSPVRNGLETHLNEEDWAGDGTPDYLRLDDEADRESFRRWFTFLAESQYYRPPEDLPAEIDDCAALIRFAYRETLRIHDSEWAGRLKVTALPAVPSVRKYSYPFTPLGAGLFRIAPGPFHPTDPSNGAFAQFADAWTLQQFNTHLVGREIRMAMPGDLLFFRQLDQNLPYHAMIFLGPSQFEAGPESWVLYHTGPTRNSPGEIRRVTLSGLFRHPSPRWRPLPGNPNFLGVHRWNILRVWQ